MMLITARQQSCGKVMFPVVCVHLSVHGVGPTIQGSLAQPLSMAQALTPLYMAPDPTVQGPSLLDMFKLLQLGLYCTPPGHVKTCSL